MPRERKKTWSWKPVSLSMTEKNHEMLRAVARKHRELFSDPDSPAVTISGVVLSLVRREAQALGIEVSDD